MSPEEKLFYSIGEVSDMTRVEPYVLRYWESEFKLLHPSKRSSGQRTYQQKDIDAILSIKHLLYEELYTIAGAKKKLREGKTHEHAEKKSAAELPVSSVPAVIEKIVEKADLLREIRSDLQQLTEEIANA